MVWIAAETSGSIWNLRWTSPTDKATLLSVLGHYPEHGTGAMWCGYNHRPFLAQEDPGGALMVSELRETSIGGGRCSRMRKVRHTCSLTGISSR